jgi:hypothetical protein
LIIVKNYSEFYFTFTNTTELNINIQVRGYLKQDEQYNHYNNKITIQLDHSSRVNNTGLCRDHICNEDMISNAQVEFKVRHILEPFNVQDRTGNWN